MYHYTESALPNVWLSNGFTVRKYDDGEAVAIADVEGLHAAIGRSLSAKGYLSDKEFRFLRKELGLSQNRFAGWIGLIEDMVSKWERLGRMPKMAAWFMQSIYLEKLDGNVKITEMVERLASLDRENHSKVVFEDTHLGWREAA